MVNRPEDRQKIIGLGIGVVLVLIYFVGFVLPKAFNSDQSQQAPQAAGVPPPGPAQDSTAAAPAALLAAAPGTTSANPVLPSPPPVDLYADVDEPPPASADPFSPPLPTEEMLSGSLAPTTPPAQRMLGPLLGPALSGAASASNAPGLAAVAPPSTPRQIITVQGVVTGADPIAVLKVDTQTLYERQGARLASGVVVARIDDFGVQFRDGYRQFTLAIGHSTEPDQPAGAPPATAPMGGVPGQAQPASSGINPMGMMGRLPGMAQTPPGKVVPVALGAQPVILGDPVPANQIASVAFQAEESDLAPAPAQHRRARRR